MKKAIIIFGLIILVFVIVGCSRFADDDNDGFLNFEEKSAGTDPMNPDSDGDSVLDGVDSAPLDGSIIETIKEVEERILEKKLYEGLYNCQNGDYSFPDSEPVFESVNIWLIEWDKLKEDECVLTLDYKIEVAPTSNPYYEIDFDVCKLTVSQLVYLKEKNADLMTVLRNANCQENTIPFLEKAIKPLDFKGQVKEIIGELGMSTTEFTYSFEAWATGIISYEDFQEVLKNEKITASKAFKDLQDLQPKLEEVEIQTKAVKAVELYLDSLNSFEDALSKQSESDFESSMDKSTAQMDEALTKILELNGLLG